MEESSRRYIRKMVPRYLAVMWREHHRTRSPDLRECLIEYYLDLVRRIATKLHARLPRQVQLDDLISAGTFGLMFAVGRYDPTRHVKFETFGPQPIFGAMIDYLRANDFVPRQVRTQSRQVRRAVEQLTSELGRAPGEEELQRRLNLSIPQTWRLLQSARVTRMVDLSSPGEAGGGSETRERDRLPADPADSPLRRVLRSDVKEAVTRGMNRTERLILILYYYERMSMKEIGQTLGCSESRVSQMHKSILARLRADHGHIARHLEPAR